MKKSFAKFTVLHCRRDNICISKLPELSENGTESTIKESSTTRGDTPATPSCQVKLNLKKFCQRLRVEYDPGKVDLPCRIYRRGSSFL